MHVIANHIGHFTLVNGLADLLRDGNPDAFVMVSGNAGISLAPPEGIMFDNLDGRRFYEPSIFYGQSKLANALYARSCHAASAAAAIAVNSVDPGAARTSHQPRVLRPAIRKISGAGSGDPSYYSRRIRKLPELPANYWSDCRVSRGSPLLEDTVLARRLWDASEEIVARAASRDPAFIAAGA